MNRGMKLQSVGMAGVYAVASRLCMLGHVAFFPSVDDGVDVMLGNGVRLQVKCGTLRNHPGYKHGVYCIDTARMYKWEGQVRSYKPRSYKEKVDFVIFWGIEENRFFVIPAGKITGAIWIPSKVGFSLSPRNAKKKSVAMVASFEEAWHLLDDKSAVEMMEPQMLSFTEVSS